jgi:hypothetical protein
MNSAPLLVVRDTLPSVHLFRSLTDLFLNLSTSPSEEREPPKRYC